MELIDRVKRAWNVFANRDPTVNSWDNGPGYGIRPDRTRLKTSNERSIIAAVLTRIALDVASFDFRHVQLDDKGRFLDVIDSGLTQCLNVEANIDQAGKAFIQDMVISMLDEGCVAAVPVDSVSSPSNLGNSMAYEIRSIRTGRVTQWMPRFVTVSVYNDRTGQKEEVTLPKDMVGLLENPLYSIMNEPNSTLKRLIRKLNLLDMIDEQSGSGKLDLIIQLPYSIKSELRKKQAAGRRQEIEDQLKGSKYGIAYTDGTERITQLNRPAENNLLAQIEYLTGTFHSQIGISEAVLNGTADDNEMTNYHNRTIVPIVKVISQELHRTFLSKSDRDNNEAIRAFRNPLESVPISKLPEMADLLTRNEIVSSNEVRQVIGLTASDDPRADVLLNKNMKPMGSKQTDEQSTPPSNDDQNGGNV